MRQEAKVGLFAAVELTLAAVLPFPWGLPFLWIGAVTAVVAVAIAVRATGLLGKRADGSIPCWSYALFGPWHAATRVAAGAVRHDPNLPRLSEVHPGWMLGGWPHRADLVAPWPAVLDLTCELPRRAPGPYLCLPTWDGTTPTVDDLDAGCTWLEARRADGCAVLVHCAHGRGRSATMACAGLVHVGVHRTWPEALAHLERARPGVRLNRRQRKALDQWQTRRQRRSPPP